MQICLCKAVSRAAKGNQQSCKIQFTEPAKGNQQSCKIQFTEPA